MINSITNYFLDLKEYMEELYFYWLDIFIMYIVAYNKINNERQKIVDSVKNEIQKT